MHTFTTVFFKRFLYKDLKPSPLSQEFLNFRKLKDYLRATPPKKVRFIEEIQVTTLGCISTRREEWDFFMDKLPTHQLVFSPDFWTIHSIFRRHIHKKVLQNHPNQLITKLQTPRTWLENPPWRSRCISDRTWGIFHRIVMLVFRVFKHSFTIAVIYVAHFFLEASPHQPKHISKSAKSPPSCFVFGHLWIVFLSQPEKIWQNSDQKHMTKKQVGGCNPVEQY